MRRILMSLSISLVVAAASAQTSVRVRLLDDESRPISNITVRYAQMKLPIKLTGAAGQPRYVSDRYLAGSSGSVSTGPDGLAVIAAVPPGRYLLCPEVDALPYVNPCRWGAGILAVTENGPVDLGVFRLNRGVRLTFRVADPSSLLDADNKRDVSPDLIVGVLTDDNKPMPAAISGRAASARTYQLVVPRGQRFRLWSFSPALSLNGPSGRPLAGSGPSEENIDLSSADQSRDLNLVVTGRKTPAIGAPIGVGAGQ